MGQQIASECICEGALLQLCSPQSPPNEAQSEYVQPPLYNMEIPTYKSAWESGAHAYGDTSPFPEQPVVSPPFPGTDISGEQAALPPSPCAAPSHAETVSLFSSSATHAKYHVTADDVLSDLDSAERMVYSKVYDTFPCDQGRHVGLDCSPMRNFICMKTAIGSDDIDMELLKVASPDEGISYDAFAYLLQQHAISEAESISSFLEMSMNGDRIAAEECRSCLLIFAQRQDSSNSCEEHWERILNTVMWDAGASVDMEQWLLYCKMVGRVMRLMPFAMDSKFAVEPHCIRSGVIGGA